MSIGNFLTALWQHGIDPIEIMMLERFGLIAVPTILAIGFVMLGLFFLSSRVDDRRHHVEFSHKGIGLSADSENITRLEKKPSTMVALVLVFFIGSFGVFYLAPVLGMALSLMVLVSSLIIFESFRWFLVVQFVLWLCSLGVTVFLLNKRSVGSWYKVH
jgi:hypothetical protein